MDPAAQESSAPSLPSGLIFLCGIAIVLASLAGVAWNEFSPPFQYYPVETYRARIADDPAGMRLIGDDDPKDPRIEVIDAVVVVERPIPMQHHRHRRWIGYDPTHRQAPPEVIAKAGPQLGVTVALSLMEFDGRDVTRRVWPPVTSEHPRTRPMHSDKAASALKLLAADVEHQSGKPEYAAAVLKSGVSRPPLAFTKDPGNRIYVYLPLLVAAPLFIVGRALAKRARAPA